MQHNDRRSNDEAEHEAQGESIPRIGGAQSS